MAITLTIATTEISPEQGEIIALATSGDLTDFRIYRPAGVIPSASIKHHRITPALAAWGAEPAQVIADAQSIIRWADEHQVPLVMNNAPWVWAFLQATAERHNMTLTAPQAGVVDVQVLDQIIEGARHKRGLKDILASMGWEGAAPTDPRGIAQALVGAYTVLEGLKERLGADSLAQLSAQAYKQQEEENLAYRKAQSLPYRPTLPYPGE